ncbi:helix-turn-helix domain-containing protein [Pseudomonas sp. J452]|uniref:helix-turn-helix domain-containing protein n=1 Tax=Pseudomonas sp. J452 TaxID=2898441 RepID=UPI0021AE0262|nr:helix-turn-helix transcriptional regulator [Pseudomonas sp. J452]UUY07315.1 helix-turn-helix domain-containing protein [Pseudomonas sp. J452]
MSTLSKRIREARLRTGLSQERLGIRIGIDPASARARMNRYELGKRVPDLELVERLAEELDLPAAYFHAVRDDEAELLVKFHRLSDAAREQVMVFLSEAFVAP